MQNIISYVQKVLIELIAPEGAALFFTTLLGVFVGFLLSYNSYLRRKEKEQNALELKYTKLAIQEMENNKNRFKVVSEQIDKHLKDIKLDENMSEKEIVKTQNIFIGLCQYLKALVTNNTLTSCHNVGAVQPLMLKEVYTAFELFQIAYTTLEPHRLNLEKGAKLKAKGCIEFITRLRNYCVELIEVYDKALACLKDLESSLIKN
jgi:hypothetical protein